MCFLLLIFPLSSANCWVYLDVIKVSVVQWLTCAVSFLRNSCQKPLCAVLPLVPVGMASKQNHNPLPHQKKKNPKPKNNQANAGFLRTGVNDLLENQVLEEKCRAETQENQVLPPPLLQEMCYKLWQDHRIAPQVPAPFLQRQPGSIPFSLPI